MTIEQIAARVRRLEALAAGLGREITLNRRRGPGLLSYTESQDYRNGITDAAEALTRAARSLNKALLRVGEEEFGDAA